MPDVQEVTVTGPTTSHWKVTGPLGKSVEWDAEITEDIPNQRIAWRSVGDADVGNAGAVRFDDRGGRTNIEVSLGYHPPGGQGRRVCFPLRDRGREVLPQLQRGVPLGGWRAPRDAGAGTQGELVRGALGAAVRAQCLDWLLIVGRSHLEQILRVYVQHYNGHRPHRALGFAAPDPPARLSVIGKDRQGRVHRRDLLGGLLHQYRRAA
jgi:hypothetical protein